MRQAETQALTFIEKGTIEGVAFVTVVALAATFLAALPASRAWSLSPLVIGILLGMLHGNTLHARLTRTWHAGIHFASRRLLRLAIVLYGFHLTVQDVWSIGLAGILIDAVIVFGTLALAWLIGVRLLGMDRETALLTGAGSAICGAAAVLAFEPVVRAKGHQAVAAVATVVLFGTTAMLLYPALYHLGLPVLPARDWGLYVGATVHEVAQVVGAASAISPAACNDAVIVKMTRVILLTPALLLTGLFLARSSATHGDGTGATHRVTIPWFALGFLGMVLFNSLHLLPDATAIAIRQADGFLLTMAMSALGIETSLDKLKGVGMRPFLLAGALFAWLLVGGYAAISILAGTG